MSGAKKPTRDGPDIFPFRVLYSPTPDITGNFRRRRETAGEKKAADCRVRRAALVEAFLRRRMESLGGERRMVNLSNYIIIFQPETRGLSAWSKYFLNLGT